MIPKSLWLALDSSASSRGPIEKATGQKPGERVISRQPGAATFSTCYDMHAVLRSLSSGSLFYVTLSSRTISVCLHFLLNWR